MTAHRGRPVGPGVRLTAAAGSCDQAPTDVPFLIVLGVAQDGGYPQAGCRRSCCRAARTDPSRRRSVASFAVVDPAAGARWLIDATPDFGDQLRCLDELWPVDAPPPGLTGVLLTHGHMGHVAGLLQLGTEAIGARAVSVWAMPRLARNLNDAALFGRLVRDHHIVLRALAGTTPLRLSGRVSALPLVVPHRDEVGEVVAYRISGPSRSALLLPDIDDWRDLTPSIEQLIADVDVAYLDGTFYEATELGRGRQAAVPHPTILHTMDRLGSLPADVRSRVRFIHLNHTNPAIDPDGSAAEAIRAGGFDLAAQGEVVLL